MRDRPIPLFVPELVKHEKLVPYLQQVDESKWYSNRGPLVCSFEERLEAHFAYPNGSIATCSSGTLAITSALLALELPRGSKCIMPAWTFVGTMSAIYAAGLEPVLVDVNLETWALDIDEVKKAIEADKSVSAVVVVCPFGKMVDVDLWEGVSEHYNLPVIIDGAACFDSFKRIGKKTKLPFIISLHATKVFGVGEGGVVLSQDIDLINKIKRITNFGIDQHRNVPIVGINAKMSEYHAAVGHAMLDEWPSYRLQWQQLIAKCQSELGSKGHFSDEYITASCLLQLEESMVEKLIRELAEIIEVRNIWQLFDSKCYHALKLSQQVISIPFFLNMDLHVVVSKVMDCIGEHG